MKISINTCLSYIQTYNADLSNFTRKYDLFRSIDQLIYKRSPDKSYPWAVWRAIINVTFLKSSRLVEDESWTRRHFNDLTYKIEACLSLF